jgi:hypothetical protein
LVTPGFQGIDLGHGGRRSDAVETNPSRRTGFGIVLSKDHGRISERSDALFADPSIDEHEE